MSGIPSPWSRLEVCGPVRLGSYRFAGVDLIHTGVSKANAAGAIGTLARPAMDGLILNVGIAGALPDAGGVFALRPGDCVVGQCSVFADEGLITSSGYQDVSEIGFPIDPESKSSFDCDPQAVRAFTDAGVTSGSIATISTCSGTDESAKEVARRTNAIAESMEGAAVGLACKRLNLPFCEVRAISNFTGDRANQQWDIKGALASLRGLLHRVILPVDR